MRSIKTILTTVLLGVFLTIGCDSVTNSDADLSDTDGLSMSSEILFNSTHYDCELDTGVELEVDSSFNPASSNELNCKKEVPGRIGQSAPHVLLESAGDGEITLIFNNDAPRGAFFEYRIDGVVLTEGSAHPIVNTSVAHPTTGEVGELDDFIYPGVGVGFSPTEQIQVIRTFLVEEKIEIRLALGAERDWDFDWTTFYFPSPSDPETRMDCMSGGWVDFGFKNQGQCIRFVNTGKDSR